MTSERNNSEELINSTNRIVRTAGFFYILIILIGVLNSVFIDSRLIIYGDIDRTINNITANEFLFRFGLAWELILYASVIILSVLLYLILKSVNKNLALLAMVFRAGEALMGIAIVLSSFIVLGLLNNHPNAASVENVQSDVLIGALLSVRAKGLYIVLFLIGIGGTLFLYLFYKSSCIPGILSIWGMFTYLSMLILSLISILFPEYPVIIEIILYGLGTLFELTIGFWLLIKGINLTMINKPIEKNV
jgi:hypothetical protein